eukprot:CAMPEP_0202685950 /NCGR_PEP_ID=MMETSP1385-20130828/1750_1 /ASSEMBLY_ACC=CAM_ASM_000861 /TAXON_ID=933848 /ORGANISM="Elphidium margaritaceum" /LENGTH=828 /DNA_ID=CAMNT_0049340425 /DNA_START=73 /DNA_END=2559 /DNA_ORIENTATION=+
MGNGKSKAQTRAQEETTARHNASLAHQERMANLSAQQDSQRRADEMKAERNRRIHEQEIAKIQSENARKQRDHEQDMKARQIAHEQRLKQLKIQQKNEAVQRLDAEITTLDNQLQSDKSVVEATTQSLQAVTGEFQKQQEWCDKFSSHKKIELDKVADDIDLVKAKDRFMFADSQVKSAINRTGQVDENVGRFLSLTSGLMDATIATTANTNKLDVEISTFGELISRECQDKLFVEEYFISNNLQKFVPFLHEEEFVFLNHLICKNDREYEEILDIVENGLRKQLALQLESKTDDNDGNDGGDAAAVLTGEALAQDLLTTWQLSQYFEALKQDGWDDPEGWCDLTDEDLAALGFKRGHISKFQREYAKWCRVRPKGNDGELLKARERRLLREICREPETWQKYQSEKEEGIKDALACICPLFCEFFTKIHKGIQQSQELLGYDLSLSGHQLKAIQMVNDMPPAPLKQIEYKQQDGDDDDDKQYEVGDDDEVVNNFSHPPTTETDLRKAWKVNSKCQIYSDSNQRWCDGTINNISHDAEGEWLHVRYNNNDKQIQRYSNSIRPCFDPNDKILTQCRALTVASIMSIDVTDFMMEKFTANDLTSRALTVAEGVEDCCMQIIKSQSTIRRSVLLAKEILDLKPAYMSDEAAKYWMVINKGVNHIFDTAIEMVRVSAQYFAYFLRFKQSFNYYMSNQDKSLIVSLELLQKDIREFSKFKQEFAKRVQALTRVAMESISQCVEQHIGASNFEQARKSRETALKIWLEKKAIYDKKAIELDLELDKHQQDRIKCEAEKARLDCRVKMVQSQIAANEQYKQSYSSARSELQSQLL